MLLKVLVSEIIKKYIIKKKNCSKLIPNMTKYLQCLVSSPLISSFYMKRDVCIGYQLLQIT